MSEATLQQEVVKNPSVAKTPVSMDLEITSRCNLRCRYCYYFDNTAVSYSDLPTEAWLKFFAELGECAVLNVTLQGGEPFMRSDLRELVNGIVDNRMRFSILTNGTLIDDEMAEFLARTGRCDRIQVSIDGSCPQVHDASRGEGSFEKAIRGLRAVQAHGIPVDVRATISRYNVDDLENIARFLLEELNIPSFGTNAAGFLGTCRRNADDVMLSLEQRMAAMQTLQQLAEKYSGRIQAAAGPLADARTWNEMEKARLEGAPRPPRGGYLTGCGCTFTTMAVRADGAFVPCVMLAHMEMGHMNQDSLREVWQHSPALTQLRERSRIGLDQFDFCKGCLYTDYCTGNCPGLSYTLTGEVDHPSPEGCLRRFLAAGGKLVDVQ